MSRFYPETDEELEYKEIMRLNLELARLRGEFSGFCKGILWWDIPEELKVKINEQIKRLENE